MSAPPSIGPGRGVSALVRSANGSYVGESFIRYDGMTWPRADIRANEINWLLRYGTLTKSELLMAAEIVGAYVALVAKPARERARIVGHLREAERILPVKEEE